MLEKIRWLKNKGSGKCYFCNNSLKFFWNYIIIFIKLAKKQFYHNEFTLIYVRFIVKANISLFSNTLLLFLSRVDTNTLPSWNEQNQNLFRFCIQKLYSIQSIRHKLWILHIHIDKIWLRKKNCNYYYGCKIGSFSCLRMFRRWKNPAH